MEGSIRLVDLWRNYRMVMEVLGLGMSFTKCKGKGREVRLTSSGF